MSKPRWLFHENMTPMTLAEEMDALCQKLEVAAVSPEAQEIWQASELIFQRLSGIAILFEGGKIIQNVPSSEVLAVAFPPKVEARGIHDEPWSLLTGVIDTYENEMSQRSVEHLKNEVGRLRNALEGRMEVTRG